MLPPDLPVGRVMVVAAGEMRVAPFSDLGRLSFVRVLRPGRSAPGRLVQEVGPPAGRRDLPHRPDPQSSN
jgi:hypothetical protein